MGAGDITGKKDTHSPVSHNLKYEHSSIKQTPSLKEWIHSSDFRVRRSSVMVANHLFMGEALVFSKSAGRCCT